MFAKQSKKQVTKQKGLTVCSKVEKNPNTKK